MFTLSKYSINGCVLAPNMFQVPNLILWARIEPQNFRVIRKLMYFKKQKKNESHAIGMGLNFEIALMRDRNI